MSHDCAECIYPCDACRLYACDGVDCSGKYSSAADTLFAIFGMKPDPVAPPPILCETHARTEPVPQTIQEDSNGVSDHPDYR